MSAIKALWHRLTTPRAVRLAQDKRRLVAVAQQAGCTRSQARKIAKDFLGS